MSLLSTVQKYYSENSVLYKVVINFGIIVFKISVII